MSIEDLIEDIDFWTDEGEVEYGNRLAEIAEAYDHDREKAYKLQQEVNEDYPQFSKINVI